MLELCERIFRIQQIINQIIVNNIIFHQKFDSIINSIKIKIINFNNVINDNIFKKHKIFEINFLINDIFNLKKRFFFIFFYFFYSTSFFIIIQNINRNFRFFFRINLNKNWNENFVKINDYNFFFILFFDMLIDKH